MSLVTPTYQSTGLVLLNDPRTGDQEKVVIPRTMAENKVPFVFQVSGSTFSTLGTNYLWYQAAVAVKYGMDKEDALQAITLRPAQMLGVDRFVGSLEVGKDADIAVLSGDPMDVNTWVDYTVVSGKVVYDRTKDRKIQNLLEPKTGRAETQSSNE